MLASKTIVGQPKARANVVPWEPPWPLSGFSGAGAFLDGALVVFPVLVGTLALSIVLSAEVDAAVVISGKVAVERVVEAEIAEAYPLEGDLVVNGEKVRGA